MSVNFKLLYGEPFALDSDVPDSILLKMVDAGWPEPPMNVWERLLVNEP